LALEIIGGQVGQKLIPKGHCAGLPRCYFVD
jgi:hypothetical protein